MFKKVEAERNCYDAIRNIDAAIRGSLNPGQDYAIVGGTATGAYMEGSTAHDLVSRVSFAAHETGPSILRPENGTARDIDILIIGGELPEEQAKDILEVVGHEVPELEISVFGLRRHQDQLTNYDRLKRTASNWLSERTIDENGVLRYELYPLSKEIDSESLKPWKVVVGESVIFNALHPAGHTLAYLTRSISGVRYKDAEKLARLVDAVMAVPEFKSEITEGAFRGWYDFALAVWDIRDGKEVNPNMLDPQAGEADLAIFRAKSRLLKKLEQNPMLVKFAQSENGAARLKRFVGNA